MRPDWCCRYCIYSISPRRFHLRISLWALTQTSPHKNIAWWIVFFNYSVWRPTHLHIGMIHHGNTDILTFRPNSPIAITVSSLQEGLGLLVRQNPSPRAEPLKEKPDGSKRRCVKSEEGFYLNEWQKVHHDKLWYKNVILLILMQKIAHKKYLEVLKNEV